MVLRLTNYADHFDVFEIQLGPQRILSFIANAVYHSLSSKQILNVMDLTAQGSLSLCTLFYCQR